MIKQVWISAITTVILLSLAGVSRAQEHPAPPGEPAASSSHEHSAAEAEEQPALLRGPDAGLVTSITTLIVFAALLAVLGKYAWGPIASGLKAREDKIRKDIADAEASRTRAEATLREYQQQLATAEGKIRDMMTRAAADAEKIATTIRMQAQQESEEIKERTTRDLDAARKAAVADFKRYAADLATSIAQQIIRKTLNADDHRDLVDRSLEQVSQLEKV